MSIRSAIVLTILFPFYILGKPLTVFLLLVLKILRFSFLLCSFFLKLLPSTLRALSHPFARPLSSLRQLMVVVSKPYSLHLPHLPLHKKFKRRPGRPPKKHLSWTLNLKLPFFLIAKTPVSLHFTDVCSNNVSLKKSLASPTKELLPNRFWFITGLCLVSLLKNLDF